MHCFGWLQKPVNTAASHRSPSFGRLSPAREKHDRWPYSQAKLQQQFLTQKVLVHLRLQSTISSPVNGRKIMPSKPYSCLLKSSLSRMDENIKLLQLREKNSQKFQFLTSRFRWLSGTFKILTFFFVREYHQSFAEQIRKSPASLDFGHLRKSSLSKITNLTSETQTSWQVPYTAAYKLWAYTSLQGGLGRVTNGRAYNRRGL